MSAPAIGLRARWNPPRGKTTIDWSHPLAQGLLYCIHADGTNVVDLISGRALTVMSGASSQPSALGRALRSTSSSGGAYLPLTAASPYPLTFTWAGTSLPAGGGGPGLLGFCYGTWGAESAPFIYGLDRTSTNLNLLSVNGATFAGSAAGGGTSTYSVISGTMVSGSQELYADGLRVATSSFTLSTPTSSGLAGLGFCAYTTAGRAADSRGCLGLIHNRVLSTNDIAALAADPFQILQQ